MNFDELKRHLQAKKEFENLDRWTFTDANSGDTSPHTYRLQSKDREYFVKEIKDNERDILKMLIPLELTHVEMVIYPDLLAKNILVTEYIAGGTLKSKDLEPGLIWDFARIQNHLNSPAFNQELGQDDRFFFGNYLLKCFEEGYRSLLGMREHDLPIVERYIEIADHLTANEAQIVKEFSGMPFARQHHDLREGNILAKSPQRIIDWGSSYGHGPFLYDLAPFLFAQEENLGIFIAHSDICRQADRGTIERWLYIATCARFVGLLRYIGLLTDLEDRERLSEFLEYHYRTYSGLLQQMSLKTGAS